MSWLDAPATETQITHRARLWLYALAAAVLVFLVVPTLIVVPMSFSGSQYLEFPPRSWSMRWYAAYFSSPEWMQATATSLKAGLLTSLFATPLGVARGLRTVGFEAALGTPRLRLASHSNYRPCHPRRNRRLLRLREAQARQHPRSGSCWRTVCSRYRSLS